MLDHVTKALYQLHNPKPKLPHYVPNRWKVPAYVKSLHMAPDIDESDLIEDKSTKII